MFAFAAVADELERCRELLFDHNRRERRSMLREVRFSARSRRRSSSTSCRAPGVLIVDPARHALGFYRFCGIRRSPDSGFSYACSPLSFFRPDSWCRDEKYDEALARVVATLLIVGRVARGLRTVELLHALALDARRQGARRCLTIAPDVAGFVTTFGSGTIRRPQG